MANNADAYGADVFFDGMDWSSSDSLRQLVDDGKVKEIRDDRLDWPDGYFDVIISDQVLEHVEDLEKVVSECARVLAPGGTMLHQYPAKEVIREAHIGTPWAHRLKGSVRTSSIVAASYMNMGKHRRPNESRLDWARRMGTWIDTYCSYRARDEVEACIRSYGFLVQHDEFRYCLDRAQSRPTLRRMIGLSDDFSSWLFRALGFDVITCSALPNRPLMDTD